MRDAESKNYWAKKTNKAFMRKVFLIAIPLWIICLYLGHNY